MTATREQLRGSLASGTEYADDALKLFDQGKDREFIEATVNAIDALNGLMADLAMQRLDEASDFPEDRNQPARQERPSLDELLDGITEDNLPESFDTPTVGDEIKM